MCFCPGKFTKSQSQSERTFAVYIYCFPLKVVSSDGLPQLICPKCEEQLNIAYVFKQQCERSDTTLREYTNTLSDQIKEESESLDIVVKPDIDVLYDDDNGRDDDDDDDHDELFNTESESEHSNYSTSKRRKKKLAKNRQCRFCNKILSTKEGLRLHERRHTGNFISDELL